MQVMHGIRCALVKAIRVVACMHTVSVLNFKKEVNRIFFQKRGARLMDVWNLLGSFPPTRSRASDVKRNRCSEFTE